MTPPATTTDTTAADDTATTDTTAGEDAGEEPAADPNGNINNLPLNSGIQTGTVFNSVPYGEVPGNTPQVLIQRPGSGRIIPLNREITVRVRFSNFQPGLLLRPQGRVRRRDPAPQRADGNLQGHNHGCFQRVARDGSVPAETCNSFVVLSQEGTSDILTGIMPPLTEPGRYRFCADAAAENHYPGRPGVRPARRTGGLRPRAGHGLQPAAPGQRLADPARHRHDNSGGAPFMFRRVTMAAVVAVVAAAMAAPAALAQDDYSTSQVKYGDDVYGGTEGSTDSATSSAGQAGGGAWTKFSAKLTGSNEVGGGDPNGSGTAAVKVRGTEVCFDLKWTGFEAIMAHIHKGAAGKNGDVVVPFFTSESPLAENSK